MTAQLPSREMLAQAIERISDAIDDAARLYGENWDSALVGGEPNYHAITSDHTQGIVVKTDDDSLHSSWLCDYLEAVDPASIRLLLARIKELDKAAHEQEPVAVVEPSDYVTAAQISDDKPRKMAVRELYEGALVIGQSLYANPAPSMHLAAQKHASGDRPAVWVRLGDSNHAPDCTLDHDEAREWEARGLEVLRMVAPAPAPVPVVPEDYFASLVIAARLRAEKAMRKFPQPNYVLNKVAEESGEVIKAVIHYTEGREEWANVEGEIIDNLAMLIRLVTEGDQVIGFTPPESCHAVAPKGV